MILSKRRGIYYVYWVDSSGHRQKVSTRSRRKSEALQFLQRFSPAAIPRPLTSVLSAFVTDFLGYAASTYSTATVELFKHALCRFQANVGDLPLGDITARHVDRYKAMRLSRVGPTTVSIELRALRSIFNTAIRWELTQANPFKNVALPRLPQQMPAYITRDEFSRLRGTMKEPWLKELVEFAVLTGMRRGEILQLQWNQVDLEKRVIK